MNLNYYLFCRKRYNIIINCLKEIIDNYELFLNEMLKLGIIKYELSNQIEIYKNDLNLLLLRKSKNETIIYNLCQHKFEDDYIDISPDQCQKISYCVICECSK